MNLLLHLSRENLILARDEAKALTNKKGKLFGNYFIVDSTAKNLPFLEKRISLTHKIYELIFVADKKNIKEKIKSFDWNKMYKESFKVQIHGTDQFYAKEFADIIWNNLQKKAKPKVNLQNPTTDINFLFEKNKVFAAKLICEVDKSFLERKAHKKPQLHPTAINPKLARAMINLLGIRKGKIYDPFCGGGGILIEAAFMGLNPIGYDISSHMLAKAKANIDFYKIKNIELKQTDATKITHSMDFVVSDLPYGKNSAKSDELDKLYFDFLKNSKFKIAVLGFPNFIDYKTIIRKAKRKFIKEYTIYLHKSLSKKIVVVK